MEVINESLLKFISDYRNADCRELRLRWHGKSSDKFNITFAITQIESRQKCSSKITSLISSPYFLVSSTRLAEQCTHERIARFHGSLLHGCKTVADLTAGLCVDSYFIARETGATVTACEISKSSAEIGNHNMAVLGANVKIRNTSAEDFLSTALTNSYDAIFIDPARRDGMGNRLRSLSDCSPDITLLLPRMLEVAPKVLAKVSPMLDLSALINAHQSISNIYVVGLDNDCKELLLCFSRGYDNTVSDVKITTLNFHGESQQLFEYFHRQPSDKIESPSEIKGKYLYEPNCCIMKTGVFNQLCQSFPSTTPISPNSHLFISENFLKNFPGRSFTILEILEAKKCTKDYLKQHYNSRMNIATRNFPLTPDNLKKRLKITDGGETYMFATTDTSRRTLFFICRKS